MRNSYLIAGALSASAAVAQTPPASALTTSANTFAAALKASFPNQGLALMPSPSYWWESGSTINAFLVYGGATGNQQYASLMANTLSSQTFGGAFDNPDASGNDDQAWWGLSALTASEDGIQQVGSESWLTMAQNVFSEQKGRWDTGSCGGGMKWGRTPSSLGWDYKSSIANGLFFQLAARLASDTNNADAESWAEKAYDWVVKVGLIDSSYNVYDGTDDVKGCIDVDRDQWSYSLAAFMYGSAVMAAHTKDQKWIDRTNNFIASAKRTFVNPSTGALLEPRCDPSNNCNNDQVSFKGILARWLGATAVVLPSTKASVAAILDKAATVVQNSPETGLTPIQAFTALEIVDADLRVQHI